MSRSDGTQARNATLSRLLGVGALIWGVAYLTWRVGWSLRGSSSAPWWLAGPALAVEIVGFVCTALLVRALWPRAAATGRVVTKSTTSTADDRGVDHDVAVVATGRTAQDLRASLVAIGLGTVRPTTIVIDHGARPDVVALATEFGVVVVDAPATDTSAIVTALSATSAPFVLMIDAGDVPIGGAVQRLAAHFEDDRVAAVQGVLAPSPGDTAEHSPNGRHDLQFERAALGPALGARGTGFLAGSGSLIRRSSFDALTVPDGERCSVLWLLSADIARLGLLVVADGGSPVVACKPLASAAAISADRTQRTQAAWQLIAGPHGVMRGHGRTLRHRLDVAAWAVRPLDGVRRIAMAGVVLAALLAGRAPFAPSVVGIVVLWAPAFLLGTVAIIVGSDGALRPGDRLRASVRPVGLSVTLALAVNSVLLVRGISDRFTHSMRRLDVTTYIGLVLVALWLLAGCLDSLRLLARRRRGRRAARLPSSTGGEFGALAVHVADFTMLGAGLLTDNHVEIGTRARLRFSVQADSGITTLDVAAVVRNVGLGPAGVWRVGLEFEHTDSSASNALAEACVVLPAWSSLTDGAERRIPAAVGYGAPIDDGLGARRVALRFATLLALAGVISSTAPVGARAAEPTVRTVSGEVLVATDEPMVPVFTDATDPPTTAVSTPDTADIVDAGGAPIPAPTNATNTNPSAADASPPESVVSGSVVTASTSPEVSPSSGGVGGLTVVGACSTDSGADGLYGTADDTYGPSVSTITDAGGRYLLQLDGDACWLSIEPPTAIDAIAGPAAVVADAAGLGRPTLVGLGGGNEVVMPTVVVHPAPTSADVRPVPAVAPTGAIGDRVWNDVDADGRRQATEPGVAGATVTLYDSAGGTVRSGRTGTDGAFLFEQLAPGFYSIGVSNLPNGLRAPGGDPIHARSPLVAVIAGHTLAAAGVGLVDDAAPLAGGSIADVLPVPTAAQIEVASSSTSDAQSFWMFLVVGAAVLLAGSVMFAAAGPLRAHRGRRSTAA